MTRTIPAIYLGTKPRYATSQRWPVESLQGGDPNAGQLKRKEEVVATHPVRVSDARAELGAVGAHSRWRTLLRA
jgi:hypothetical protein